MVFKEDLPSLFHAFHDRLEEDGKDQKIIKCAICCLELPSHSTRSTVCEMCFETDFWEHLTSSKKEDTMFALKVTKSGIAGRRYFQKGCYVGETESKHTLSAALLFSDKDSALKELRTIEASAITSKEKPELKLVKVLLLEQPI